MFDEILVHEGKMMEVKSSFALHRKVDIDKVVSPRQQANEPGNEEYETLDALQVWMTVCNDTSENQTCSKENKNCCASNYFPVLPYFWVAVPGLRSGLLARVVTRICGQQRSGIL